MRILLIEPDQLLAKTYIQALELAGHTVDHAATGQAAIIAADEHCPDLVVMELQLPGINGIGFLQEFRSYSDWRKPPVILHTYMSPRHHDDSRQLVAAEYNIATWLYKPQTSLEQLIASVRRYGPAASGPVMERLSL